MPLSRDKAKRQRQLDNLQRGLSKDSATRQRQVAGLRPVPENLRPAPPAPIGNQRRLLHGGRSELLLRDVEHEVAELAAALGDAVPVHDRGEVPAADVIAVEAAARALKRWRSVSAWCDANGRITKGGKVKQAAELELRAENQLHQALDRLGLNPSARAKLGLDLMRAHRSSLASFIEGHEAQ